MILTRYLYNLVEVKHSLFLSIIRHKEDETLFWICELYYSGFDNEIQNLLENIYNYCYTDNKILKEYSRTYKKKIKCKSETTKLCAYATFAINLCYQNFDLKSFAKQYFELDVTQKKYDNKIFKESLVEIKKENLKKFISVKSDKVWSFLRNACKYPISKEYNKLFNIEHVDYMMQKEKLFNHWLYYCKDTPIWIERINEFNGVLDEENEEVVFEDENKLEEFYNKYGYEPEDQPIIVIEKLLGQQKILSKNINDFCEEFCLENNEIENTIKLNPLLNIKDNYLKIKSLEVLKEWFNKAHKDEVKEINENNIPVSYSNEIILQFPIVKIGKKSIWNLPWNRADELIYMNWYKQFNNVEEKFEKECKNINNPITTIDFVVHLKENITLGIDVVYNDFPNIPEEKIELLRNNHVNNYYQVKAEWILSNYGCQKNIVCKKLL